MRALMQLRLFAQWNWRCAQAGIAGVLVGALSLPLAAQPAAGLGQNIGRGFSDADDKFGEPSFDEPSFNEPGFDIDTQQEPAQESPQVLPVPDFTGEAQLASGPIAVSRVVVEGNTVLPPEQIQSVIQPFENRDLSRENLRELRRRLSLLYFNAGYINSGVLLPYPLPEGGVLTLQAIEGELREIQLLGNARLTDNYLEPRLRQNLASPLNINDLQDSLRYLERNPLISQLNASLVPGLDPGQADLRLRVEEADPIRIGASLDNHRSPGVGAERLRLTAEHLNLSGRGDRLALALSASEGLNDFYVGYRVPIDRIRSILSLDYSRGDSEVVEEPFDDLDIESDTEEWSVIIERPLIDSLNRRVAISAGLGHSETQTSLLGSPFSFALGARDGEIGSTSVILGGQWVERWDNQVLALRSTLRYGIDEFGATTIPSGAPEVQLDTGATIPESKFTLILTQAQYARLLPFRDSQLVISALWQAAEDPLLSVDKLAIGGVNSVRGFRENQLVRDNGVTASIEWRVPVFPNSVGFNRWNLTAIPFFDYGQSWDEDKNLSTSSAAEISSVGLGLRWRPHRFVDAAVYYGERLSDDGVTTPQDDDLQDNGFHFSVSFQMPLD